MPRLTADHSLVGLVYSDSARAEATLAALADYLQAHDLALAGLIQRALDRPASARCDMELEDLATGARTAIADDRGSGAVGCALDTDALLGALVRAQATLEAGAPLVLAEGAEFRGARTKLVAEYEDCCGFDVDDPLRVLRGAQFVAKFPALLDGRALDGARELDGESPPAVGGRAAPQSHQDRPPSPVAGF